jgi:protein TonB
VETTDYENMTKPAFVKFLGVSFLFHIAFFSSYMVMQKHLKVAPLRSPPIEVEIHDMEMKKPEPPPAPVKTPPPIPQVARVVPPQPVTEQTPPKQETVTEPVALQSDSASPDAAPVYAPSAPAAPAPQVTSNRVQDFSFGGENGPAFLTQAEVHYPLAARRMGREGKVLLRLTLDERGKLLNLEVLENPGYGFADAAIAALKKSCFSPASINNRPVACRVRLPIRFALRESE